MSAMSSTACGPPAAWRLLDPMMLACGGTWVAHGSGDADRLTVDADDRVRVPPDNPRYNLRRVWLTKAQEEGYYHGLANSGLWPLCHVVFTRPIFEPAHWEAYREVNELFAQAVLEEAADRPAFVFIQDYHFGLLARMLKQRNPNLKVAHFWHIPWPNPETFRAFPWKDELLEGLLSNDVLGFHVSYHCQNFLETVDRNLKARIDRETSEVQRGGHSTLVRPFPISIDFDRQSARRLARRSSTKSPAGAAHSNSRTRCLHSASSESTTPREFPSAFALSIAFSIPIPNTAAD